MSAEIILERSSKTYTEGERMRGVINIKTQGHPIYHNSIMLDFEGVIKAQLSVRSVGALDSLISQINPQTLAKFSCNVVPAGDILENEIEYPFDIPVQSVEGMPILESYTGVYICVQYELRCMILKRPNTKLLISNPQALKITILSKRQQIPTSPNSPAQFVISPATVENPTNLVKPFVIRCFVESDHLNMAKDLTGHLIIESNAVPLKGVDLQLVRVETVEHVEGTMKESTEVQSLQIVDGDPRKNIEIPIYMTFPRLFTSPSLNFHKFRVDFELNFIVMFTDGCMTTKNFPIKLFR